MQKLNECGDSVLRFIQAYADAKKRKGRELTEAEIIEEAEDKFGDNMVKEIKDDNAN